MSRNCNQKHENRKETCNLRDSLLDYNAITDCFAFVDQRPKNVIFPITIKEKMDWNVKIEMVKHFNNGEYKEGVDVFLASKDNLDAQAIDMFATGMSLREEHIKFAEPCVDILKNWLKNEVIHWRAAMRIGLIIDHFDKDFLLD